MTLFTIESQEFGWDEIVVAAEIWGEWRPFVETVRQSLACLGLAATTGRQVPSAESREAANAFRYAHNLISAEDARRWLANWEMSVEDWMNCLRGQLLRERWAEQLDEIVIAHPISDAEVAEVIKHHVVCADKLTEWAVKLAGRAAVAAKSDALAAEQYDGSASNLVSSIEAVFNHQSRKAITPKLVETQIADHRLEWIHFDCRYVWFPDKRTASEASWCLIEDGLTLDQVAYDAHGVVQQWNFYLDEIEAPARPHFLAARAGDWLGPIKMIEGFPLFSIDAKRLPAAADPLIRERAERAIVAGFTERAINERVKWATPG